MYNQDNLGIYDINVHDADNADNADNADADYFNNSANIQGASFMEYRNKFTTSGSNEHELLTKSSSPEVGSIIEAMDGTNSIDGYQTTAEQTLSADEDAFNALLSQYTTAYNSYISSTYMTNINNGIQPSATDSSNNTIKQANLQSLNNQLLNLATKIVGEISALKMNTYDNLRVSIEKKKESLIKSINELKSQHNNFNRVNSQFDVDSVDGGIETSTLHMNSVYLHYIVYFFIGVILIVFIFNISVNPEADTKKASFFIIALFSVYIISRWVNK